MKKKALIFILFFCSFLFPQKSFMTYYQLNEFLQTSPGAFKYGLYGFENPALTTYINAADVGIFFTKDKYSDYNNKFGLFTGTPFAGFGMISQKDSVATVIDYRYSFALGNRDISLGLGYGFVGGNKGHFKRSNSYHLGLLSRPTPYFSVGLFMSGATENNEKEFNAHLAIRPIKNYPLTIFGDIGLFNDQNLKDANWSAGVSYEFLDGIRLNGRYFNSKAFTIGLDMSFGYFGVGGVSGFDKENKNSSNTFILRFGAKDRSIFDNLFLRNAFLKINLSGKIKYQKSQFFDDSNTLFEILSLIDEAKNNSSIKGLVINAINIDANKEIIWEIREKLKEFRAAGKKVVIFIERATITNYHLASIADKIVMDEFGIIALEGYLLGRSFYKNLFEKVGIGFEEFRYFKYKSAVESYSREKMSEADKEQRQKLVDDWFSITKNDICSSRNFTDEEYFSLTNGLMAYTSQRALANRLVDTIGRWNESNDIVRKLYPDAGPIIDKNPFLTQAEPFDDKWSEPKKIAIIYAIGECAMESGINARSLANDLKTAFARKDIKAIVLRVDSPGGDAMASDYISKIIADNKGKKPVVVSQGSVAASGGYWLSMNADKIVSSPMTITGSIGVIGGFIYDKGLAKSMGITTDFVKSGKYADAAFMFALPLINIGVPVRNVNEEEKNSIEMMIKESYSDFVKRVSDARKKSYEEIDEIAQGRVWSGLDAKRIGIIDELGGLSKAIEIAKDLAGIKYNEEVKFVQFPKPPLFDLSNLLPSFSLIKTSEYDRFLEIVKLRVKNNGIPMPIMSGYLMDEFDLNIIE